MTDATAYRAARRFAYADPPYVGQAKAIYGKHPDYAGEVDHAALIARLESEFDGWALSLSVTSLPLILSMCPPLGKTLRVCAWGRGQVPRAPARLMWSWEPLIVKTPVWQSRRAGDYVRDCMFIPQQPGSSDHAIKGQKPVAFSHWVFDLLGLDPADELVDLFPGSGAVGIAWERWRAQTRLAL